MLPAIGSTADSILMAAMEATPAARQLGGLP
jgi:hypothetical protein